MTEGEKNLGMFLNDGYDQIRNCRQVMNWLLDFSFTAREDNTGWGSCRVPEDIRLERTLRDLLRLENSDEFTLMPVRKKDYDFMKVFYLGTEYGDPLTMEPREYWNEGRDKWETQRRERIEKATEESNQRFREKERLSRKKKKKYGKS